MVSVAFPALRGNNSSLDSWKTNNAVTSYQYSYFTSGMGIHTPFRPNKRYSLSLIIDTHIRDAFQTFGNSSNLLPHSAMFRSLRILLNSTDRISSFSSVFPFAPISRAFRTSSEGIHDSTMGVSNAQ